MAKSFGAIFVPVLLVSVLLLLGCAQQSQSNQQTGGSASSGNGSTAKTGEVKSFDVVAKQFEFVPGTITVKKGDTVRLKITSKDVEHGIAIPEFGVDKTIPAGETVTVEFVASKTGTFEFHCNVFCGEGHKEMTGKLVVEE
ncbi:MAG: cytochrome c oxidase subunit II [Candidatus Diapherotrites archaeon]|nr:cytochrome c oxidase subunit II [Candidatus Diapherotrites archaeon]